MSAEKLKVAILGVGPSGGILAAYLGESDLDLYLIDQGVRFDQIKKNGVIVGGYTEKSFTPDHLLSSITDLKKIQPDLLFICTKTGALKSLLPIIKECVTKDTWLISYQNGIGPEDEITKVCPQHKVGRFVINYAGNMNAETGNITMTWFHPPNSVGVVAGECDSSLQRVVESLNQVNLNTELVSTGEIARKAFLKGALNAALSPLCTITSLTMSEAMGPSIKPIISEILRECLEVGDKLGYNFGPATHNTCLNDYLAKGGNHHPSMWEDLQNRRRTEIDYINGKVVEKGARLGLQLPYNRMITSMIVAKEIAMGLRPEDDIPKALRA